MFSLVNSFSAFDFNQINNRFSCDDSGVDSVSGAISCSNAGGCSSSGAISSDIRYITLPFFFEGKPASESFGDAAVPSCVMSLASAGSLRYNSGLENPPRKKFLNEVLPDGVVSVPVYLMHSKTVFVAEQDTSFQGGVGLVAPDSEVRVPVGAEGDGIITSCRSFAPCVTAADCMPVFLWDSRTGAFGICHSGWKGTGIAAKAVALMCTSFGAKPADICVILGPHIHECCYTVDAERAAYFRREFSPDCVSSCENDAPCPPADTAVTVATACGAPCSHAGGDSGAVGVSGGGFCGNKSALKTDGLFRLSLARANIVSLVNAGIKPENILHCTDCTSCFSLPATSGADYTSDKTAASSVAGGATISSVSTSGTPATAGSRDAGARFFPYGSFRRQTAHLPEGTPLEERFKVFSAMAAVIGYGCGQK